MPFHKYLIKLSAIIILLSLFNGCKKDFNSQADAKKTFIPNPSFNLSNCTDPQRYRDSIFSDAEIRIVRDSIYRRLTDYAPNDSFKSNLYYDYYEPIDTNPDILRPLIILMHGGGFTYFPPPYTPTRMQMDYAAKRLAKHGYCVASIETRFDSSLTDTANYNVLGSNVLYSAIYRTVQDTKFAIRFAKSIANVAKLDTNYFFVGGVSQGGITALHTAYLADNEVPPTLVDITNIGLLDYGANMQYSSKVRGVFSYAGGVMGLEIINQGDIPALNIMSKKDNYFPYNCGIDYTYQRVYVCGANSVAQRLSSQNIVNTLILLEDNGFIVPNPIPGNFLSHSHGSIYHNQDFEKRDVDTTINFLYRTFSTDPCQ